MRKLIILDRDGVINHDANTFIKSPEEWHPIPGALSAIAQLNHAGYTVVVATNQSGIARGLLDKHALEAIHQKMHEAARQADARIDAVFFCPHAPEDHCACRKPKPGMLLAIAARYHIPCSPDIIMVGDSLRDLQAAEAVKCTPYLVLTGKGQTTYDQTEDRRHLPAATHIAADLAAVVAILLKNKASQ